MRKPTRCFAPFVPFVECYFSTSLTSRQQLFAIQLRLYGRKSGSPNRRTAGIQEYCVRNPLPDLGEWPALDWEQWKETAETLHMCRQVVGKTRLALTPLQNHWWNIAFYLSARGLTTSAMPVDGGRVLDIEFDFASHELVCRTSEGEIRKIPLRPVSVAQFFEEFTNTLASLGVSVKIDPTPVEVTNPIRCDFDTVHCSYDGDAVNRFWHVLRIADTLLKRFSTNFYGKISPVHFFWGSFDLAVTRFNGKRAPVRPGADSVQAEAYSHEVISAGFWPGNGGYRRAAFLFLCGARARGARQGRDFRRRWLQHKARRVHIGLRRCSIGIRSR
jgi:hypothetical protein